PCGPGTSACTIRHPGLTVARPVTVPRSSVSWNVFHRSAIGTENGAVSTAAAASGRTATSAPAVAGSVAVTRPPRSTTALSMNRCRLSACHRNSVALPTPKPGTLGKGDTVTLPVPRSSTSSAGLGCAEKPAAYRPSGEMLAPLTIGFGRPYQRMLPVADSYRPIRGEGISRGVTAVYRRSAVGNDTARTSRARYRPVSGLSTCHGPKEAPVV